MGYPAIIEQIFCYIIEVNLGGIFLAGTKCKLLGK